DYQPLLIEREASQLELRRQAGDEALGVPHRAVRAYHDRDFVTRAGSRGVDHLQLRYPDLPHRVVTHLVVRSPRGIGEPRIDPSRKQVPVEPKLLADFVDRGDVDDVQADHDVDRLAVFTTRLP